MTKQILQEPPGRILEGYRQPQGPLVWVARPANKWQLSRALS